MIQSMTGYGSAKTESNDFAVSIEIKTLNSKYLDFQYKLPRILNEKEIEFRNLISAELTRGKVTVNLDLEFKTDEISSVKINEALFRKYYNHFKKLSETVQDNSTELFKLALQQPDVLSQSSQDSLPPALWDTIQSTLNEALQKCNEFRSSEGASLARHLLEYNAHIEAIRKEIVDMEKERAPKIKQRIVQNFEKLTLDDSAIDENRMEQEIVYYLEKLDITEEIDRLGTHTQYFEKTLKSSSTPGKKLGFICQEIGREVNTIGSKANDAGMQKKVVLMKEELEKMKEQVLNIL